MVSAMLVDAIFGSSSEVLANAEGNAAARTDRDAIHVVTIRGDA